VVGVAAKPRRQSSLGARLAALARLKCSFAALVRASRWEPGRPATDFVTAASFRT